MKSMTGYGRGECSKDGFKITVELSSVNRKQTEISVNLPREMEMLEAQIRDLIIAISRGAGSRCGYRCTPAPANHRRGCT